MINTTEIALSLCVSVLSKSRELFLLPFPAIWCMGYTTYIVFKVLQLAKNVHLTVAHAVDPLSYGKVRHNMPCGLGILLVFCSSHQLVLLVQGFVK